MQHCHAKACMFLFLLANFNSVCCTPDIRQYTRIVGKVCRPAGINAMTAKIDGTAYCRQISPGGTASPQQSFFLIPQFPYLALQKTKDCKLNFTCPENNNVILSSDAAFFRCTCAENFGRVNGLCEPCDAMEYSPVYSDRCFMCPQHTKLSKLDSTREEFDSNIHDVRYCTADTGYKIVDGMGNIGALLHEDLREPLFTVEPCVRCQKQTVCDLQFMRGTQTGVQPTTPCVPGSYRPQTNVERCVPCPRPFYCTGSAVLSLCPAHQHTLKDGASDIRQCVCRDAGIFRSKITGACERITNNHEYSPLCTSYEDHLRRWCEEKHQCRSNMMCAQGVVTVCSAGMFFDTMSAGCVVCPRGFYCVSGGLHACPMGSTTVATMSESASYCQCHAAYVHEPDATLEAGFSCHIADTGSLLSKQIAVKSVHTLSDPSLHHSMIFHMKKYTTSTSSSVAGILSINADTRQLFCYFMADTAAVLPNTTLTNKNTVQSIYYTMVSNLFPLVNSEIVSATMRRVSVATSNALRHAISLEVIILNRFDGIVYRGSVAGTTDEFATFALSTESWQLKYRFEGMFAYSVHLVPAMHMLIAVHQTSSVQNSSHLYYNLIVIREQDTPLSITTIGVPFTTNVSSGTYNLSQITMGLEPNYTTVSFDMKHVFRTTVNLDPWRIIRHDIFGQDLVAAASSPYTVPALTGLRLSSGPEIDIFDAFRAERLFFTHPLTKQFGVLTVQYGQCGSYQSTHRGTGFSCECNLGYTKHRHSNQCVLCDNTQGTCCRSPEECMLTRFRCSAGYFVSVLGGCELCPEDAFCHGGLRFHCPLNSKNSLPGSFDISSCKCRDGHFLQGTECKTCPSRLFCHSNRVFECPKNMQTIIQEAATVADCRCLPGFFLYSASTGCEPVSRGQYWLATNNRVRSCPPNMTTAYTQSLGLSSCRCMAGFKFDAAVETCVQCLVADEACYFDSRIVSCDRFAHQKSSPLRDRCVCVNGYYDVQGHTNEEVVMCKECPRGFYCSSNNAAGIVKCPAKMSSPSRSPSLVFCECESSEHILTYNQQTNSSECQCDRKFYSDNNRCTHCPAYMHVLPQNSTQLQKQGLQTCTCINGYMMGPTGCVPCRTGYVCDNRVQQSRQPCPFGTFSPIPGLQTVQQCLSCGANRLESAPQYARAVWSSPRTSHESCLGGFVAIRTLVHINVVASVFKFTAATDILRMDAMRSIISTVLNTDAYDIAYDYNNILQVTVTMRPEFINACMSVLLQYPTIWSKIVLASQQHATTYIYTAHGIFCSIVSAAAQQLYASDMRASLCQTPFHPSKFTVYPLTQSIVSEFMHKKRGIFPRATVLVQGSSLVNNIRASNEVVRIHNFFNAMLPVEDANRIVIVPVHGTVLAVFADTPGSALSLISSSVMRNSLLQTQSISAESTHFQLADCGSAVHALFGECTAAIPDTSGGMCNYCEPDMSFFSLSEQQCKPCTPPSERLCSTCCQNKDTLCVAPPESLSAAQLCGNTIHDFTEECDGTDLNSPLRSCCNNCKLDQGYYSDPPCTTRCGDFVVAIGIEECDSPGDFTCDMFQCKNVTRNRNNEL